MALYLQSDAEYKKWLISFASFQFFNHLFTQGFPHSCLKNTKIKSILIRSDINSLTEYFDPDLY